MVQSRCRPLRRRPQLPAPTKPGTAAPTTGVLTEQQAGKNPKNVGGDAAVNVAGPESAKKP